MFFFCISNALSPAFVFRFFFFPKGPMLFISLFIYLLMRGGQPRPYASPRSSAAVFSFCPLLFISFWVFFLRCYADAHWCAQSESTRLRTVFLFLLSSSLIMLRWMYLCKIWCKLCWFCHQKVCKSPQVHSTQCPSIL